MAPVFGKRNYVLLLCQIRAVAPAGAGQQISTQSGGKGQLPQTLSSRADLGLCSSGCVVIHLELDSQYWRKWINAQELLQQRWIGLKNIQEKGGIGGASVYSLNFRNCCWAQCFSLWGNEKRSLNKHTATRYYTTQWANPEMVTPISDLVKEGLHFNPLTCCFSLQFRKCLRDLLTCCLIAIRCQSK